MYPWAEALRQPLGHGSGLGSRTASQILDRHLTHHLRPDHQRLLVDVEAGAVVRRGLAVRGPRSDEREAAGHLLQEIRHVLATHRAHARLHVRRIGDRKSTRLNSSHLGISYAVFCLKKKKTHLQFYTWAGWLQCFSQAGFRIQSAKSSTGPIGLPFVLPKVRHIAGPLTTACVRSVS